MKEYKAQFAKALSNLITQTGLRYAKKYKCSVSELGVSPEEVAYIATMVVIKQWTPGYAQKFYESLIEKEKE